jgi:Bacterial cell division membrane protein
MKFFEAERVSSGRKGDRGMLAAMALLVGIGIAALWSASSDYALSLGKGPGYFALRQAVYLLPGLLVFWLCATVDLDRLRAKTGIITLCALGLMLLPFVPGLGENRNGATRWIDLRFTTFQPSELWKPASILYLAHILDKKQRRIGESAGVLIPPFLLIGLGCLLIYAQNDFSTAAIAGLCAIVVFWIAQAPASFFLGLGAAATPLVALSVLTSDFRLRRILAFLFPAYEPHGQGYQVLGSIKAIRSGGFFGVGLGLGNLKRGSIPEVQSDFILAAWTEETGFLGVLAILALFGFVVWRAFRTAFAETDGFRSYLGMGMAFLLGLEALVNAAVAAGAVPATGIALPFFSAGGSSLVATAVSCGLLYNLSSSASIAEKGEALGDIFAKEEAADA